MKISNLFFKFCFYGAVLCIFHTTVTSQSLINSDIIETNTLFGSNIYKPNGIYFSAVTNGNIPSGVYYLDDNEELTLIQEAASIQFEHNDNLILKKSVDHELYVVDLNTNSSTLFFDDSNIFLISQRIIEVNDIYYFVGFDIAQNHYAMMTVDLNGALNTLAVFNGPVQNTNRLHQDNGILYYFTNTLSPSAQHYYSFNPSSGIISTITSQEYSNHPYTYFNNALSSVNANGTIYTLNNNSQLATSSNDPDLTCFDLVGSEGSPRLEILGSIDDKVYLVLNFNLGSTNGLYRYPQDSSNGLCQNDCSNDTEPPICIDGPFTIQLDDGQDYYTLDINDFVSDNCSNNLTYESLDLNPSTPNNGAFQIFPGSNDQFLCGTYIVDFTNVFDNAGNLSECNFTFTVECDGGTNDPPSGDCCGDAKIYGSENEETPSGIIRINGATYILAQELQADLPYAFIAKYDDSNNLIWQTQLDTPSLLFDVISTGNNELIMVGREEPVRNPNGSWRNNKSIIVKLNESTGSLVTANMYDFPGRESLTRIIKHSNPPNPNYPYYISGFSNATNTPTSRDVVRIGNVDHNLNVNWYNSYPNTTDDQWSRDMKELPNGNLQLMGDQNGCQGILTEINALNGEVERVRETASSVNFRNIKPLQSGNLLLSGNTGCTTPTAAIILLNSTYEYLDAVNFDNRGIITFEAIHLSSNESFFATGKMQNGGLVIVKGKIMNESIIIDEFKVLKENETSYTNSYITLDGGNIYYADGRTDHSEGLGMSDILLAKFGEGLSEPCLQDTTLAFTQFGINFGEIVINPVTQTFVASEPININTIDFNSVDACQFIDTCNNTVLNFDGFDDRIISQSPLSGNSDYTISLDFKSGTQSGGTYPRLIGFTGFETEIAIQGADLAYYNGTTWRDQTGLNVADNEWHNVTLTRSNATNNLYLDGQLISSDAAPATLNFDDSMSIGGKVSGSNEFFCGSIDNVKVWDYTLSSSEICNLIETPISGNSIDYNFEEGIPEADNTAITELTDQSGNNISGSLNNFTLSGLTSNFLCDSISIVTDSCGTVPPTCSESCQTNEVDLSTGIDFIDSSILPIGQYDGGWVMISGPDMNLNYPQPGFVLNPDGAWSDELNAQFISPFANTSNNMSFPEPYIFERQFCICESTIVQLDILALFDNFLEVGLYDENGTLIQQLINVQSNSIDNFQEPTPSNTTHNLIPGTYSLRAGLRNDMQVSMGFAIEATLSGAGLIESGCCSPYQYITGTAFEDMDCDSTFSFNNDTVLAGIPISLCDAMGNAVSQTTTDELGFYSFFDVSPGSYTVKQDSMTGLFLTLGDGGYTIDVTENSVTSNIDFGTCNDPCAIDTESPICAVSDITVALDSNGLTSITPSMIDGGSSDQCSEVSLSINQDTFTCDEIGSNIVVLTVTDEAGNTSSCSANVTVVDVTNPTCLVQPINLALDQNGQATISPQMIDAGSSDECSDVTLEIDIDNFNCDDIGDNEVTLFVTDASGNSSSCRTIVTVEDKTAPICAVSDITVSLDNNGFFTVSPQQIDAGSVDECGDIILSILGNDTFGCDDLATTQEVILLVTDQSGNTSTCSSKVEVIDLDEVCIDPCDNDTTPPTVACPALPITLSLDNNGLASIGIAELGISATDNCPGKIRYDFSQSIFTCVNVGQNSIIVTVYDESGNAAECPLNINIIDNDLVCDDCDEDTAPPVVICSDVVIAYVLDENGQAIIDPSLHGVSAFDDCGINQIISEIPVLTCADLATTPQFINIIATDLAGNTATCTISYILIDLNNYCIPPECPADCYAGSINLSTGVDIDGAELPVGQYESNWQLISGPDQDINYPRPGYVLNPNAVWDQLPGTQYISPFPNASNNQSFSDPYIFERCFCVCQEEAVVQLDIAAHVDNFINIGLYDDQGNEIQELIDYQNPPDTGTFLDPAFTSNSSHNLLSGTYCLRAGLRNDGSATMGMQINAAVTNAGFEATECCNPNAFLLGTVFEDMQCDSILNNNQDSGLEGLEVSLLQNNAIIETTTTDIYGYYVFSNVEEGDYTIEVETPTTANPSIGAGGIMVSLNANSAIGGIDFGFCFPDDMCCGTDVELEATACQNITSASIEFDSTVVVITPPNLEDCQSISQIFWGDGEFDNVVDGQPLPTHAYANNGTWIISIEVQAYNLNGEVCNTSYVDLAYTINACPITSTNPIFDEVRFKVFPVPFNEFVELQFNNNSNGFTGSLFDMTGALVRDITVQGGIQSFTLDTQDLISGVYTIRLTENNTGKQLAARIIKVE